MDILGRAKLMGGGLGVGPAESDIKKSPRPLPKVKNFRDTPGNLQTSQTFSYRLPKNFNTRTSFDLTPFLITGTNILEILWLLSKQSNRIRQFCICVLETNNEAITASANVVLQCCTGNNYNCIEVKFGAE